MDLPAVTEALLIASEDPLPAPEIARLVRARITELEDQNPDQDGDYSAETTPELDPGLADLSRIDEEAIIAAIAELNRTYDQEGRSFLVLERAKGWKVFTRPEFGGFVRHLFPGQKPRKLSGPALETLAIVAYRQPVTKSSIEHVRGVACDSILQKLLDLELVKIQGRADLPGRPLLYATTDYFFEHFGIKTIDELPNAAELRAVELPEPAAESEEHPPDPPAEEKQLALVDAGSGSDPAPPAPATPDPPPPASN